MELAPFRSAGWLCGGCRGFKGPCPSTPRDANGYVVPGRIATGATESNRLPHVHLELAAHPRVDPAEVAVAARRELGRGLGGRVGTAAVDRVVSHDPGVPDTVGQR